MLLAIIGESCVGKTTLANEIKKYWDAEIYCGKDYLKMEKNPAIALESFKEKLREAIHGSHLIYVITEEEHVALLPEQAIKVVLTADLSVIKARFTARLRGNLPSPISSMLERKHGMFDQLKCDLLLQDGEWTIEEMMQFLKEQEIKS